MIKNLLDLIKIDYIGYFNGCKEFHHFQQAYWSWKHNLSFSIPVYCPGNYWMVSQSPLLWVYLLLLWIFYFSTSSFPIPSTDEDNFEGYQNQESYTLLYWVWSLSFAQKLLRHRAFAWAKMLLSDVMLHFIIACSKT